MIKIQLNKKLVNRAVMIYCMVVFFMAKIDIFAGENKFSNSKLATGTMSLLNDVTTWLMGLIPILGGLLALYFFGRKSAANEQEQHIWDKRLKVTGGCIIGGTVASSIITVVTSYYQ